MTVPTKSASMMHTFASNQTQQMGRFGGLQQRGLSGLEAQMVKTTLSALKTQMSQLQKLLKGDNFQKHPGGPHGGGHSHKPSHCHPAPPSRGDSCHPSGNLKTDANGIITTPGGYKIQATGQHEWQITGPDGKSTRVWGDPHVAEGDGGKWDFKRDSTFVLGDGTRINVDTVPWGDAGATVTGGLEIISGNDRIQVTDVDKGKGKVGQVTADGYQRANSFGNNDVFVMGQETDDWSFQGREIIGSNNLGETFNLGNKLAPGNQGPQHRPHGVGGHRPQGPFGGQGPNSQNHYLQQMSQMFNSMASLFSGMASFNDSLSQRCGNDPHCAPGGNGNWLNRRQEHLGRGFEDIGRMFDMFSRMESLNRSVQSFRGNMMA
ncbi:DUF1521 domain-containing protein [Stigmatella sp. ncwal1]|uniref:DUF1521 domain-containing protein n=1 Tax=Stigmatella ashevillensis TaxID=2995309 RepID=A0ABT5DI98_9BACT|nr:DUF1521 domain-containing protein [Stigmatella ashevillena]MDC0712858.1 DUF1521 domain-containing protein [Stigmatella ashevillena]